MPLGRERKKMERVFWGENWRRKKSPGTAVANLSDLTGQQWSEDHRLATAALEGGEGMEGPCSS